jgi:predicted enzyme related to lactoylglutathione lyase
MTPQHKIGAIVFSVADLGRTIEFYTRHFGLSMTRRSGQESGKEQHFAYANLGDVSLVFFERPEKSGRSPVIVFELDSGIDTLTQTLAAAGVTIVTPVSHAPGGWSSDFLDPDGHMLSYYQTADKPRSLT